LVQIEKELERSSPTHWRCGITDFIGEQEESWEKGMLLWKGDAPIFNPWV
jgi:hypothetical protein